MYIPAMKEINRVLKPNGYLLFFLILLAQVPYFRYTFFADYRSVIGDPSHVKKITVLKTGFTLLKAKCVNPRERHRQDFNEFRFPAVR